MEIISGNILDVQKGIIVHQVNCLGVMGAGLAKHIRDKYPQHYQDYIKKVNSRKNKRELLGKVIATKINDDLYIVGIFGQYDIGYDKCYTDYNAIIESLDSIAWFRNKMLLQDLKKELDIYIPYGIGCGLAGGDWNKVSDILNRWEQTMTAKFNHKNIHYVNIVQLNK